MVKGMKTYKVIYIYKGNEAHKTVYANTPQEAEGRVIDYLITSGQWADCKVIDIEEILLK